MKIPKIIVNGSDLLLMGFPHSGSSYYLLIQLDKDFKPLFKLLETQPDPCGRSLSVGDSNQVIRFNKIDIGQMQMVEDELNLSLLDWEKLFSSLPNGGDPNQTSEIGLLPEYGQQATAQMAECSQSSFSSVIDEVFEFEKGDLMPPFPIQSHPSSSFSMTSMSHLGSLPTNRQMMKTGMASLKWDGGQISSTTKVSSVGSPINSSMYPSNNIKGLIQPSHANSLSSSPVRSPSIQKLTVSKSEQELSSLRSPSHSLEIGPMDEDQVRLLKVPPKEAVPIVAGSWSAQLLSPLRTTSSRVSSPSIKPNALNSASTGPLVGSLRSVGSSPLTTSAACKYLP